MKKKAINYRRRLKLFTALTLASSLGVAAIAKAQTTTPAPVVVPGDGTAEDLNTYQIEKVKILYKKLLLREKDIPNAVTELGAKQVQAANPTLGSIQTLLTQSPSVVAYSQQPGQDNTTLAIRGVANNQLAETLDGVPINDLLDGSTGNYVSIGDISSPVTLNEISGVTLYPGLAPPAKQGFGTTGGTIAYATKQPTDDRYEELEGGFGSFDTQHFGFTINTGDIGSGPDAAKVLMLYDQSQTAGYVSNTPAQFHDFMLNAIKPYDDGLSKVGLVIIFNQGKALTQTLPAPTALIQAQGYKFNYPISDGYYNAANQDLLTILSDQTYINQYAIFNGSLFYSHINNTVDDYESADAYNNGYVYNGNSYSPNIQGDYNFFSCLGSSLATPTAQAVNTPFETYDPTLAFGSCQAGETDNYITSHQNTIGITPSLTLFPDQYNTIVIGGLIAKTTGETNQFFYGGTGAQNVQIPGYNSLQYGGGGQRTIYSGYVQDTARLLDNKLQITPGLKVDASYGSNITQQKNGVFNPAQIPPIPTKLANYTKIGGYYLGASYNLPDNFVLYGSLGKGSLFAPVNDYSQGTNPDGAPTNGTNTLEPEIVHLYEGGLRYDTPRLLLNVDYYYENISDAFAFFTNYLTDSQYYSNNGGELYRGVEGNGDFRVTPDLSVFGNFSYNETEYTKSYFAFDTLSQDQFGYAFTGTPLSNVPNWNGLIGVDYTYGPFSAYATGQYTGQEFTTDDLDAPPYGNTYYIGQTADGTLIQGNAQNPYGSPTAVALRYTPNNPNGCDPLGETASQAAMTCSAGETVPANPLDGATVTNQKVKNPANFIVNLLLTYKIPLPHDIPLKSLTADINATNIFDDRYYSYTYSSENGVGGIYDPNQPGGQPYNSAFVGEPRAVTVDLVARF
jgi:iron complex outermembrane receptor protein